jgi:hypothetical protein
VQSDIRYPGYLNSDTYKFYKFTCHKMCVSVFPTSFIYHKFVFHFSYTNLVYHRLCVSFTVHTLFGTVVVRVKF